MPHSVFQQVAHQSGNCRAVRAQLGRLGTDIDVAVSDATLAHHFAIHDVIKPDRLAVHRQSALISASQ
jgi:hypothetical protein